MTEYFLNPMDRASLIRATFETLVSLEFLHRYKKRQRTEKRRRSFWRRAEATWLDFKRRVEAFSDNFLVDHHADLFEQEQLLASNRPAPRRTLASRWKRTDTHWYFRCECGHLFCTNNEFDDCPKCGAGCESFDYR